MSDYKRSDDKYDKKHKANHNRCELCKALGMNNETNCNECNKERIKGGYYKL